jgi:hypothetical protein
MLELERGFFWKRFPGIIIKKVRSRGDGIIGKDIDKREIGKREYLRWILGIIGIIRRS